MTDALAALVKRVATLVLYGHRQDPYENPRLL